MPSPFWVYSSHSSPKDVGGIRREGTSSHSQFLGIESEDPHPNPFLLTEGRGILMNVSCKLLEGSLKLAES